MWIHATLFILLKACNFFKRFLENDCQLKLLILEKNFQLKLLILKKNCQLELTILEKRLPTRVRYLKKLLPTRVLYPKKDCQLELDMHSNSTLKNEREIQNFKIWMLIAPFRASSCGPIFQYRLFYLLKFILFKNFEIIRCYSEVMKSPFYIVKSESFTIEGMPTRAKKGLPTKVTFWTFRSNFKHCAS